MVPIPAHSRMAGHIARMEEALRRLRGALPEGEREHFSVCDASRGENSTPLSQLRLSGEEPDFLSYYRFWALELRDNHAQRHCPQALLRADGPQWIRLQSSRRLLWGMRAPELIRSLEGLSVSVLPETSWHWDWSNLRPGGRPTYVPVYQMLVSLAERPLDATVLLEACGQRICAADHPLADKHLLDWQEDVLGRRLFHSYRWKRTGFDAVFESRALMERAKKELFSGLRTGQFRLPSRLWALAVELAPQPVEQA